MIGSIVCTEHFYLLLLVLVLLLAWQIVDCDSVKHVLRIVIIIKSDHIIFVFSVSKDRENSGLLALFWETSQTIVIVALGSTIIVEPEKLIAWLFFPLGNCCWDQLGSNRG